MYNIILNVLKYTNEGLFMVQKEKNNSLNLVETQVTEIVKRVDKPKRSKRSNGEGTFYRDKKGYLKGKFSNLNKKNGRC